MLTSEARASTFFVITNLGPNCGELRKKWQFDWGLKCGWNVVSGWLALERGLL
jgi:hypothetical protein